MGCFPRDSKTISKLNEPSVFEPLMFYCLQLCFGMVTKFTFVSGKILCNDPKIDIFVVVLLLYIDL